VSRDKIQCPAIFRVLFYDGAQLKNLVSDQYWVITSKPALLYDPGKGKIIPETPGLIEVVT